MATWEHFETESPELAGHVREAFATGKHKVLATLRKDGSPRVSGTEVELREGELLLGSMTGARKADDLRRDARLAIHGPTVDQELKVGDAKVAGRAVEITDPEVIRRFVGALEEEHGMAPPEPFHLFRVELTEVVLTRLAGDPPDHMEVVSWHEGRGTTTVPRYA